MQAKLLSVCMVQDGDKVLLINKLHHPDPNSRGYIPPGGKIEPGESPVQGAIREVYEETGLRVSNLIYKGLYEYENSANGSRYIIFNFLTKSFEGDLLEAPPEGALEWVPIEVASTLPMERSWHNRFKLFFEPGTFEFHTTWDDVEQRPTEERLIQLGS